MLAMASGRSAKRRAISAGGLEMALGVALQQAAGVGERDVIADAGEDVEQFALRGRGVGDAVGGDAAECRGGARAR